MDLRGVSDKMDISSDRSSDRKGVTTTSASSSSSSITPIIHCNTLNLSQYISRYKGHTKLIRLHKIAEKCPELQIEAYRLLIDELKKGINTSLYSIVSQQVSHKLGAEYELGLSYIIIIIKYY